MATKTSAPVEAILDAALSDAAYRNLVREYADMVGAHGFASGWATGPAVEAMFVYENSWTPEMVARYHAEYAARDVWTHAMLADPRFDTFIRMTELVAPAVYAASPLWTELLEPNGDDSFHALGLKTRLAGGLGGLTFYRGRAAGDFTDAALAAIRPDEAMLARLVAIRATVAIGAAHADTWEKVADSFAGEVLVLAADGRVVQANRPAETRLADADGLVLDAGRLAASDPDEAAVLAAAITGLLAATGAGTGTITITDKSGAVLRFQLLRIASAHGARLLMLGELPQFITPATLAHLQRAFALSPAEADVIAALAGGANLAQVAAQRGSTYQTVRTQYRAALAKLGCRRMPEAVSLLRRFLPVSA